MKVLELLITLKGVAGVIGVIGVDLFAQPNAWVHRRPFWYTAADIPTFGVDASNSSSNAFEKAALSVSENAG
jgi:hypothetical protein